MSTNISTFLTNKDNISFIYNSTVELSAADNLVEGQYVLCLGYNDITDGCRTVFRIVDKNYNAGEVDYYIDLNNNLKAELIIENDTVNILQLGGKPVPYTNDKGDYFDNADAFNRYLSLIKKNKGVAKYKLYVPSGIWCTSPVDINTAVCIEGSHVTWEQLNNYGGTTITAIGSQSHIFAIRPYFKTPNQDEFGDQIYTANEKYDHEKPDVETWKPANYVLKNITFSSGAFEYMQVNNPTTPEGVCKAVADKNHRITHSALRLHNTVFGTFENIGFHHVWGKCMTIKSCWELRFSGNINIMECCNPGDSLITFARVGSGDQDYHGELPGISNIEIYNINVESVVGNIFKVENCSRVIDTLIQNIHIEPARTCSLFDALDGREDILAEYSYTTTKSDEDSSISMSIFDIKGSCKMIVNNIIINNIATNKWVSIKPNGGDAELYCYDTIFNVSDTPPSGTVFYERVTLGVNVGTIMIQGMNHDCNILKTSNALLSFDSYFTLDSLGYSSRNIAEVANCVLNVQNFPSIICNAKLDKFRNSRLSLMSNDFNACYKNVYNYYHESVYGSNDGYIHYDPDSLNDLSLVVKPKKDLRSMPFMTIPIKGKTLCVRAKITANSTYYPRFVSIDTSTVYQDSDKDGMEGSGEYKLYEIDISGLTNQDVIKNNPLVNILTSESTANNVEVSLDTYYFKD